MHVIRLRYPWIKQFEGSSEREKVEVPEPPPMKPSAAVAALAVYTRNFNKPSGLEDAKRVTLLVSNWYGELRSLMLNDQPLEVGPAPIETDVRSFLTNGNRIEIQLASIGGEPACLSGEVRLQITE